MNFNNTSYYFFISRFSQLVEKNKLLLFLIVNILVIAIIVTGCTNTNYNTPTSLAPPSSPASASPVIAPIPCFPVQKSIPNGYMAGCVEGKLVLEDNYLRVNRLEIPYSSHIIIWPYGCSLDASGSKMQVLNARGQPAAVVGDYVFVGGGELPDSSAEKYTGYPLPETAQGPYWMAGPPADGLPHELAPMFPLQKPVQFDYPSGAVEGTLLLEKGYLMLDSGSGRLTFLIWPAGYSCRIENYVLHVVDETGQSLAAVGDKIQVNGAEMPREMWGKHTGSSGGGPDKFTGPYWLVSEVIK